MNAFYIVIFLLLASLLTWMLVEIRKSQKISYVPARSKAEPIVVFNGDATMKIRKFEK